MQFTSTSKPDHTDCTAHQRAQPPSGRLARSRRLRLVVAGGLMLLLGSACTPEQVAFVQAITSPYNEALTDEQLYELRMCESTDNYQAIDPTGAFRGAYQFNRATWNSVASRHFEWLVGVDPAEAEPWWQDAMTRALYSERGRNPWPVCGRRL